MKKSFLLVPLLFLSILVKSQNNLQLNQVLTYNGWLGSYQSSPVWTVPNGKIWKIEFRTASGLKINGSTADNTSNTSPIWLKSGDNVYYFLNSYIPNGMEYFISILEFNLVP